MAYISGSLVTSTATFKDRTGALADPATITLKYNKNGGAVTTVVYPATPIVRDGVGVYHADFDTTGWTSPSDQKWITEWTGTGGGVQAINSDDWAVTAPEL
jgi:hypothetical protein